MTIQCYDCPWKKSTKPATDIPNGYCRKLHRKLKDTIAEPGTYTGRPLKMMACHESELDKPIMCIGWAAHQIGPGNNISLRLQAMRDPNFPKLETVGPQHKCFEDTLPK